MKLDFFESDREPIHLDMIDADVLYYPIFFEPKKADDLYKKLLNTINWQQDTIKVFGKTYLQPRLTSLYANNSNTYTYSNVTMHPNLFTEELLWIKNEIEKVCLTQFTTCLLNLYRNGQDSNGWHSDNEKELGKNPVIASVSFGEERRFHLKHKAHKDHRKTIQLQHGSLLIMQGPTQEHWLHQIPKTSKVIQPRINLTYRVIQ